MEFTEEQKMYADIIQKAWEDEDFKKGLVANPVSVIENFIGQKLNLPEGKKLIVNVQTNGENIYLNIPVKPALDSELTEEQLEMIAGGGAIKEFTVGIVDFLSSLKAPSMFR